MKRFAALLLMFATASAFAQQSDLSGLKFCIDPGHGGHNAANDRHVIPDPGTDFWESESNFQTALQLKPLLEARGATVILTRNTNDYPNDALEPSLEARVALANANNVDWFHSIHTNATGLPIGQNTTTNYTLMLIREKRPGGPYSGSGNGLGVPEMQESWDISLIIAPKIMSKLRTKSTMQYLDWTFYGGTSGGFSLGVLRGLAMPGELSEAAFHDYYPETRRLMNNGYLKMEAYALRDAFMQYFSVPADTLSIIAGIESEVGTGKLVDAVHVRLMPENILYTGDLYHNGFYMFDGIKAGTHWVRFETPGFKVDSLQVDVAAGTTTFKDHQSESTSLPVVVSSSPVDNDTAFAASGTIQFVFSKPMDTASVRASFSIAPSVNGRLLWTNNNINLTFKPDSVVLPFSTSYVVTIAATALSQSGLAFDGNGDGTAGDAFQVHFKTRPVDVWPPAVVSITPAAGATLVSPNSVINLTFDEPLDQKSVSATNIVLQEVGTGNRPLSFQYYSVNGRSALNVYPQGGLKPGRTYKMRYSGITDLSGNPVPTSTPLLTFATAPIDLKATSIEDFASSVASWFPPGTSGSTIGIVPDSTSFTLDTVVTLPPDGAHSGRLTYSWNTATASDWLIREYLSGGPGRSVTWNKLGTKLQAYVYGDGGGMQFRFAVDDSVDVIPAGTGSNHEVNLWTTINWIGWKLVEWDFEKDSVGSWLGNGVLEGALRFDSFQLRYLPGTTILKNGIIYIARVQVVQATATDVGKPAGTLPLAFELFQNYPNPFNPTTTIRYQLPAASTVSLKVFDLLGREIATLVDGVIQAGNYVARWDGRDNLGRNVASGLYLYRLQSGSAVTVRKMLLMK